MTAKTIIENWAKAQALAEQLALTIEFGANNDGHECVVITDPVARPHRVLRKPTTLVGALNFLTGYKAGLANAAAAPAAQNRSADSQAIDGILAYADAGETGFEYDFAAAYAQVVSIAQRARAASGSSS